MFSVRNTQAIGVLNQVVDRIRRPSLHMAQQNLEEQIELWIAGEFGAARVCPVAVIRPAPGTCRILPRSGCAGIGQQRVACRGEHCLNDGATAQKQVRRDLSGPRCGDRAALASQCTIPRLDFARIRAVRASSHGDSVVVFGLGGNSWQACFPLDKTGSLKLGSSHIGAWSILDPESMVVLSGSPKRHWVTPRNVRSSL